MTRASDDSAPVDPEDTDEPSESEGTSAWSWTTRRSTPLPRPGGATPGSFPSSWRW
ncbi:hypothetical protein [Nesterenkonia pannonica]|uniref:hypothetical protein n=1 Tax=Nesterenkonia pannonica TaxID=1548602 RepID=UPI0021647B14|nr:hypothetical protein [Nesterenkonia pannonica]